MSSRLNMALAAFNKKARLEKRVEIADGELNQFLLMVPEDEMDEYVSVTTRIQNEVDKKYAPQLAKFEKQEEKMVKAVMKHVSEHK